MCAEDKKYKIPDFHVLIAAGGSGTRFGGAPKQYQMLCGKPVIRHSLEVFLSIPQCRSIHVIYNPDHAEPYHDAVMGLNLPAPVAGGKERNISILNGLQSLPYLKNEDIVLVHDAARPLVAKGDILALLETMTNAKAASLAVPVTDTMRRAGKDQNAAEIVEREGLWALQTPQAFHYGILKEAHEKAQNEMAYTDDTSMVSALGIPVKLVPGSKTNIKITAAGDMMTAEKLMSANYEMRTGTGFDVHAFETEDQSRKLMICGVEIDHEFGLKGHSDADVGLHALTDALLGALGDGDIGRHFPPSNDEFKDMDSAVFLEKVKEMLAGKNAQIQNIDITVICETPKISPYRDKMQTRVAEVLKIDPERVNIKATTTEGLGFTGRREGIAAQAVATLKVGNN